ncbi:MFS transporter [Gynuella sp.]|uniref:MFS transporter n=1 Tax=Gynuella sp. TaxID=2969146 RepID=UPI003D114C4B
MKSSMPPVFFYPLLISLLGDLVVSLLAPILVYQYTQSLSLSGLAYAIEWLIRIVMVPLFGKLVDDSGIKKSSILFDCLKLVACLFIALITVSGVIQSEVYFALLLAVLGGFISVANAQLIIIYEKYISENHVYRLNIERNSVFITIADQLAMILGALIVIASYKMLAVLFVTVILSYSVNLYFFLFIYKEETPDASGQVSDFEDNQKHTSVQVGQLFLMLFIASISVSAFFSNIIDGLVEASGSYVIQSENDMPIELYALISASAGVIGFITSSLTQRLLSMNVRVRNIYCFSVILELIFGLLLFHYYYAFPALLIFYAFCIGSKIPRIVIMRKMRIELIPQAHFAKLSSLIVSISQSALPVIGVLIFYSKNNTVFDIRYLVLFSSLIVFLFSLKAINLYEKHRQKVSVLEMKKA